MALGARGRATSIEPAVTSRFDGMVPPSASGADPAFEVSGELKLLRPAIPILGVVLMVLALVAGVPILYYMVYAVVALVVLTFIWTRSLVRWLSVTRVLRTKWCVVGEPIVEEFILRNGGRLPALWVEVRDESTVPGYEPGSVQTLGGFEQRQWRTRTVCNRRGLYELGPLRLVTGDPFGIFQGTVTYHASTSFIVYPPLLDLPDLPMPYGRLPGTSRTHIRSLDVTTDASSIRAYAPGDSLHRIHWLSSARAGELRSKEFDFEPSGNLWAILDLDRGVHVGEGLESTEEYAVNVTGALIHRALRDNKSVGLVAIGRTRVIVQPGKGSAHLWRLMEVLATVRADGVEPLDRVLSDVQSTLGRGLSVVTITPSTDPAWLQHLHSARARATMPAVILIDAATFASRGERPGLRSSVSARALQAQLGSAGFQTHVVQHGQQFQIVGQPAAQTARGHVN